MKTQAKLIGTILVNLIINISLRTQVFFLRGILFTRRA
jgi:hypothetical protein